MSIEEPTQNTNEPSEPLESPNNTTSRRYRLVRESPSFSQDKGEVTVTVRKELVHLIKKHHLLSNRQLLGIFFSRVGHEIFSNKLLLTVYSILFIFFLNFLFTIFIIEREVSVDTPGTDLPLEAFVHAETDKGLSEDISSLSVTSTRLVDPYDYASFVFQNWKYRKDVDLLSLFHLKPTSINGKGEAKPRGEVSTITMGSDILDMQTSVFINMMKYKGVNVGYHQKLKVLSVDYPKDYKGLWNIYPDDTLVSINGQKLVDALDLEIAKHTYSDTIVSLEIEREGNPITVVTELPNLQVGRVISFTDPDYYVAFNKFANLYTKNIVGRSAGVSTALAYYDTYIEDVSKDRKIALSGVLNPDGTIIPISGVNLKTIQAIHEDIDILFFANDVTYSLGSQGSIDFDNYSEAKRTLKRYNSDITLVGVDTFDDILNYLKLTETEGKKGVK